MKKFSANLTTAIALVLCLVSFASAQSHIELTPSLTISETYDDNIFLDPDHEKSDYITGVTPGFNLDLAREHTTLGLSYTPTFVWYADETDNNTVRHAGSLSLAHDLTENLRFDLSDTYTKSEEPLEDTIGIEGVRGTRNTYQRNTGSGSISYIFGPGNSIIVGYRHSLLENDDSTIDDGREQGPFATITYWLNVKNGFELSYAYTDAKFSRDDNVPAGDDYTGQSPGIRYIYRFNPHQRCSIGYDLTTRNFDGVTEDYKIHHGTVRYEQDLSEDYSMTLGAGLFRQDNDTSSDETGPSYDAAITKRFQRGTLTIGGEGGWDEAYLEAERRGFTRYQSINGKVEYKLLEPLTGYAGATYRHDEDDTDREWNTSTANCGLRWSFLRWFTAGLEYRYAKRDDDVDSDSYTDNQVILTVTGSRLFRW